MKIKIYVDWEEQDIITEREVPSWLEKKVADVLANKELCASYKNDFLEDGEEGESFHDFLVECFKSRLKFDCQGAFIEV